MCVLGPLEDNIGKVRQEGVKAGLKVPDHFDLSGELIPQELLDGLVVRYLGL